MSETLQVGDFPNSPVIKTLPSNAGGMGLIPGQGCGQKNKNKNIDNQQGLTVNK